MSVTIISTPPIIIVFIMTRGLTLPLALWLEICISRRCETISCHYIKTVYEGRDFEQCPIKISILWKTLLNPIEHYFKSHKSWPRYYFFKIQSWFVFLFRKQKYLKDICQSELACFILHKGRTANYIIAKKNAFKGLLLRVIRYTPSYLQVAGSAYVKCVCSPRFDSFRITNVISV